LLLQQPRSRDWSGQSAQFADCRPGLHFPPLLLPTDRSQIAAFGFPESLLISTLPPDFGRELAQNYFTMKLLGYLHEALYKAKIMAAWTDSMEYPCQPGGARSSF
jgi:hypothetical protein